MKTIKEDLRRIKRITFAGLDGEGGFYSVGDNLTKGKVEKIVPYEENGEMAPVLWFAIYEDDEIAIRVNGKYIDTVQY